jgi:hypothetical protein
MIEDYGGYPPVSAKATGVVLNPWYEFPSHVTQTSADSPSAPDDQHQITPSCRIDLEEQNLRLLFHNDAVVFVFTGAALEPRQLVNPIRYFLTYQTFINYNLISPVTIPLDTNMFDKVDHIPFKVERITRVEIERQHGDEIVKGFYHTGTEEQIEITADSIAQYLRIINPTIYYSIAFYLIGCENPRYFLIEFYKAVEAIKNGFGSENSFLASLRPYGVTKQGLKDFTKVCNDMRLAPLDIGRHAPMPNAPLYSVELRNLLVETRSRDVFESSTMFCRQVINAYTACLSQQAA